MTIQATFIGINKHHDPAIGELGGARRDATALWALFADSVPGITARLLVDEQATLEAVRQSVLGSLATAGEDDVVVITFAGHGSPDGHLVLFDTQTPSLAQTGLAMDSLAHAFRQSRARAVLCVLDCCFSGQAPARVLEMPATPRNPFALTGVAGEGRVLLAACASNESAWEQPGTGHGLLTSALIQAWTAAAGDSVSLPAMADEIIRLTRVEAQRIRVTQTPVFLGSVQGGLSFPVLRRGENYAAAFPAHHVRDLSGAFEEFDRHGFPPQVVAQWAAAFPGGLNALQLQAVNEFGALDGQSLLVVAPTSSGKTLIGELAAIQAVSAGKKAVFLLPYRALVNEKFEEFTARYGPAGVRIVRCSGDSSDGVGPVLAGRYDLAFFTYEMFLNLALRSPKLLAQLGLVVLDEGQFITDPQRGIVVELTLALLLRGRERDIRPQLLVLSAVIGRLNGFERWLNAPVLRSTRRPVPLIEGVLDRAGFFQFVDVDGASKTESLLAPHQIVQRREKPSSQDVIVPLVQQLVGQGEKVLIFRNQRGSARGCAMYLATALGLRGATQAIDALPTQDLTASSQALRTCLAGGTAFHSTDLLRAEREAVEKEYRRRDGAVHALVATTTLAAGINTPASTVILAESEFVGEDGQPYTVAQYKNMAGRAGRVGFNETGRAIILADTPMQRAQLFGRYVLGTPEDITSSFHPADLATWTLRLLSQVSGVRPEDLPNLLVNTFGGYCASRDNPGWTEWSRKETTALLQRMLRAGLVEQDDALVHLTLLGRACGASSLSFESSLRLIELLRGVDAAASNPVQMLGAAHPAGAPMARSGRSGHSAWRPPSARAFGTQAAGRTS